MYPIQWYINFRTRANLHVKPLVASGMCGTLSIMNIKLIDRTAAAQALINRIYLRHYCDGWCVVVFGEIGLGQATFITHDFSRRMVHADIHYYYCCHGVLR